VTDQTLSGSGGTVKWTLKDIDVGIVGKCIVTVDVAITYKDGSGTIGHCEEKKPKPTCFLDIP
jgi:hypothetical protein